MTITEAIALTRDDRSYDRQWFFDVGKSLEFTLPAEYRPTTQSEALYFATEFGFRACPREQFGSLRNGEKIAYGALREGIVSAAYARLLHRMSFSR